MNVLVTKDLTVGFGGVRAVDGVSLSFARGGVHALIGPNGAGKTSFINAVTGMYRVTSGRVTIGDADVTGLRPHKLARLGVTRTFQNLQIFWTMTVLENVVCGFFLSQDRSFWRALLRPPGLVRRSRELEEDARAILRSVGLESRASEMANTLSYGELKRLEIARALAVKPKVLFLDEPVAGCSMAERTTLAGVIRALADENETTIVLVEHDLKLVMSISDRITVLVRGKVLADGAPDAVRNDRSVIEAYLGPARTGDEQRYAATH